jgi:hypothetical protein
MKVKTLEGKEVNWILTGYMPPADHDNASALHLAARALLKQKFPTHPILEEVKIPEGDLWLDFYLPKVKLAVEVQGRQHSEYVPFFHGDRNSFHFVKAQKRDKLKRQWCELNHIMLVELPYSETIDEWARRFSDY